MKKLFFVAIVATSLFACKSSTEQKSAFDLENAKKEIIAANKELTDALSKGDSVAVASAYSADGALMSYNAPIVKGKENLIKSWGAFIKATGGATVELNTVEVWGDENYLTEEGTFVIKSKEGTQMDIGKYLVLWKKEDGKWKTTYTTPAAKQAVDILNASPFSRQFINNISSFSGIPAYKIKLPTTKSGLKEDGAVPLDVMKQYFSQPNVNRYIANQENYNLGKLVTEHYTEGKKEPAYYMQAGDDFYLISKADPLKLGYRIPTLSGFGDFKVRVSTRSEFYEIQAEIKITKMPNSDFSLKPGTRKKNPFLV